jgi:hypothetical protein
MTLAHTILAMVGTKIARVRCNTCGGDHAYRTEGGTPAARSKTPTTPRATREDRVIISFQEQLAAKDVANARTYSPKDTYRADEVIRHPTFGLGIVKAVRSDKVDVAFKADEKTLVHGRGGSGAKPTYQPPAGASNQPADKPQNEAAEPPSAPKDVG